MSNVLQIWLPIFAPISNILRMNTKINNDLLNLILEDARSTAILFGVTKEKYREKCYVAETIENHAFEIRKREIPNKIARLDTLYINNLAVGCIFSLKISASSYHMASLYILEDYRSKQFYQTLSLKNKIDTTPALYLLSSYVVDIVKNNKHITLEVTNNNESAWRLYEKPLASSTTNITSGFHLLSKNEIQAYAKIRGKKIGKWYELKTSSNRIGTGVQWSHIPDYGGKPERWSTNRIYHASPIGEEAFIPDIQILERLLTTSQRVISILLYGSLIKFLLSRIYSKIKNLKSK